MIGWVLGAGTLGLGAWALLRKRTPAKASGSIAYSNGWVGEWRISKLPTGWLGQFRIGLEGFGDPQAGWLNVPHGLADTSNQARLLALEQLALNDPTKPDNTIVDSGNVTQGGKVYHWAVVRIVDTGLYRPMVATSASGVVPPDDQWQAIAADRFKPQEARNLCLEWIAQQA